MWRNKTKRTVSYCPTQTQLTSLSNCSHERKWVLRLGNKVTNFPIAEDETHRQATGKTERCAHKAEASDCRYFTQSFSGSLQTCMKKTEWLPALFLRLQKVEPLRHQQWHVGLENDEKLKWSEELANRLQLQGVHQRPFSAIHHPRACDPPQGQFPWSLPTWTCSLVELKHKNNNTPGEAADADLPTARDTKAYSACTCAGGAVWVWNTSFSLRSLQQHEHARGHFQRTLDFGIKWRRREYTQVQLCFTTLCSKSEILLITCS